MLQLWKEVGIYVICQYEKVFKGMQIIGDILNDQIHAVAEMFVELSSDTVSAQYLPYCKRVEQFIEQSA